MKRKLFTAAFTVALAAVAGLAVAILSPGTSFAYSTYDGCIACHPGFQGGPGATLHDQHTSMGNSCTACHSLPVGGAVDIDPSGNGQTGCVGCHVATGLREHHRNVTPQASTCGGCHASPETAPAENVAPPLYGSATFPNVVDPCNTSGLQGQDENWDGNAVGLDNDGDTIYDGSDPDCQGTPPPAGGATYNPGTGAFTAGETKVGGKAYSITLAKNTALQAGGFADAQALVFTLTDFAKVTPSGTPDCTYTGSTGVLACPTVSVSGLKTTYNVIFDKLAGGFVFQVRSAKKNR